MSRTLLLLVLSLAAVACLPPEPTTPPAVDCGPTNCNGCCSKDGACQPGGLTSACGRGGGACTSCFASQVCRGGGCSSAGTTPDAGSPSFIPATGAALQVDAAAQVSAVGSATASSASVYVPVRLHLANGDLPSLPLSAALFTLRTAAGLDYSGSASLTAQHLDGCPAGALLAPGAEVHCTVVFEVPASTTSKELVYKLPGGDTLTTPLAVPPCDRCSTRCVDLLTDVKNCGRCGRVVQVCAGGEPVCATGLTWCTSRCADLSTESANCGACGAQIAVGQTCRNGLPSCAGSETACPTGCFDLERDVQHCGACNNSCVSGQTCAIGQCAVVKSTASSGGTCSALCNPRPCLDAFAEYYTTTSCTVRLYIGCRDTPNPNPAAGGSCGSSLPFKRLACACTP